jgi:hypothetical protein
VEAEHQQRQRREGEDRDDHRPAHRGVVAESEDDPVVDERERGQRLRQRGAQQRDDRIVADGRVGGERGRRDERQRGGQSSQRDARGQPEHEGAARRQSGRLPVAGAERGADVDLGRDRERVQRERQQVPDPVRDLLPGQRDRP